MSSDSDGDVQSVGADVVGAATWGRSRVFRWGWQSAALGAALFSGGAIFLGGATVPADVQGVQFKPGRSQDFLEFG